MKRKLYWNPVSFLTFFGLGFVYQVTYRRFYLIIGPECSLNFPFLIQMVRNILVLIFFFFFNVQWLTVGVDKITFTFVS